VSLGLRSPVQALVLSSPALDPGLNVLQKLLLAVLPRSAPDLRVGNGLNADFISHDPAVVRPTGPTRWCTTAFRRGWRASSPRTGPATVAAASAWTVPTLLMYAGGDRRLVHPAGSRLCAQAAPAGVVTARCFDDLYHEIFNESSRRRSASRCSPEADRALAGRKSVLTRAPVLARAAQDFFAQQDRPACPIRSPALPRPPCGRLALGRQLVDDAGQQLDSWPACLRRVHAQPIFAASESGQGVLAQHLPELIPEIGWFWPLPTQEPITSPSPACWNLEISPPSRHARRHCPAGR
jgi:hypothetical protein